MDRKTRNQSEMVWSSAPGGADSEGVPTLLVVDDEPSIRNLVRTVFELEGFRVLAAESEEEAVLAAEMLPVPLAFALIDVRLREGSGPGAAARIRHLHPEASLIFMSGHGREECVGEGSIRHSDPFLAKPFDLTRLRRAFILQSRRSLDWTAMEPESAP